MNGNESLEDDRIEYYSDDEFEVDSLFDSASPIFDRFLSLPHEKASPGHSHDIEAAQNTSPPIPGLFFNPSVLIPETLATHLVEHAHRYFSTGTGTGSVNQAMLFGRASEKGSGLPLFIDELILSLSLLLKPHLPSHVHTLLFPSVTPSSGCASRQAILNHYTPGEGITPHVDLLTRFADGIIGVSLGSGTVMTFQRVAEDGYPGEHGERERWDLYLPERSVIVLTGDARYRWTHGIEGRLEDCIADEEGISWLKRGTRVSITLRWLLLGADIVGDAE